MLLLKGFDEDDFFLLGREAGAGGRYKWVYRTIDDMPGDILITGVDGVRVVLQRYEAKVGKETLGVMQAMDGNNVAEIAQLLKKAVAFADSMGTGYLSKNDAWFALTATIMKTMEYPVATTTITETEWNTIMTPILLYYQVFPEPAWTGSSRMPFYMDPPASKVSASFIPGITKKLLTY
jgi:hypothetical protein